MVKTQKEKLAENAPYFRWVEFGSTLTFVAVGAFVCWRLRDYAHTRPNLLLSAFLLGWLSADFVSGFVHWAADTWGTTDWPLIGPTLIRNFREHHVDPEAITRHDFIETNGSNCLISLPILFWCAWASPGFIVVWMFSMVSWVFATNQIHKWSHQKTRPNWVNHLQRMGLIMSPEHHAIHHVPPYISYYCITAGWLNRPLTAIGFFRWSERVVTTVTGALPRDHDQKVFQVVASESHEAYSPTGTGL